MRNEIQIFDFLRCASLKFNPQIQFHFLSFNMSGSTQSVCSDHIFCDCCKYALCLKCGEIKYSTIPLNEKVLLSYLNQQLKDAKSKPPLLKVPRKRRAPKPSEGIQNKGKILKLKNGKEETQDGLPECNNPCGKLLGT